MKNNRSVAFSVLVIVFLLLILTACSVSSQLSANPQVEAIENIRPMLGLPDLPLEFVEEAGMINSPDAQWTVATYKDGEGRKYFVEIETNRVVEIDGRDLLSRDTPVQSALTLEELRARAEKMVEATFPSFTSLQPKLTYEEG